MTPADPDSRGLIAEAFRMPDLGEAECRSIFLDWVLGLPEAADVPRLAATLLARAGAPDHPMTAILQSAAAGTATPRRRGRRGRISAPGPPPPPRAR